MGGGGGGALKKGHTLKKKKFKTKKKKKKNQGQYTFGRLALFSCEFGVVYRMHSLHTKRV